jgi:hypothetical protein
VKELYGAALQSPSREQEVTSAMGRGAILPVISQYFCILVKFAIDTCAMLAPKKFARLRECIDC